jgi:hypothetical protein
LLENVRGNGNRPKNVHSVSLGIGNPLKNSDVGFKKKKHILIRRLAIPSDYVPESIKYPVEQLPEDIRLPLYILSRGLPHQHTKWQL